jgi:hypothetical protein
MTCRSRLVLGAYWHRTNATRKSSSVSLTAFLEGFIRRKYQTPDLTSLSIQSRVPSAIPSYYTFHSLTFSFTLPHLTLARGNQWSPSPKRQDIPGPSENKVRGLMAFFLPLITTIGKRGRDPPGTQTGKWLDDPLCYSVNHCPIEPRRSECK